MGAEVNHFRLVMMNVHVQILCVRPILLINHFIFSLLFIIQGLTFSHIVITSLWEAVLSVLWLTFPLIASALTDSVRWLKGNSLKVLKSTLEVLTKEGCHITEVNILNVASPLLYNLS